MYLFPWQIVNTYIRCLLVIHCDPDGSAQCQLVPTGESFVGHKGGNKPMKRKTSSSSYSTYVFFVGFPPLSCSFHHSELCLDIH